MRFCSLCGASVELRIPPDDNRARHVCTSCGEVHYQNPKLIVGAIPEWQGRILLCRRAIEPRQGNIDPVPELPRHARRAADTGE